MSKLMLRPWLGEDILHEYLYYSPSSLGYSINSDKLNGEKVFVSKIGELVLCGGASTKVCVSMSV